MSADLRITISLLTSKETAHGVPFNKAEWDLKLDHNYSKEQVEEDNTFTVPEIEKNYQNLPWEHTNSKQNESNVSESLLVIGQGGVNNEILHKFPNPDKEPDRFRDWIYKVGGDILGKENLYIYKYRKVCHLHFEDKYLTQSKMLSRNAVPTLYLSGFLSVKKHPLLDKSNQISEVFPAVASTSGSCSVAKQPPGDPHKLTLNQTSNILSAVPSTSGIFKKDLKTNKKNLLKQIKLLQKDKDSYQQRLKKARKLATNTAFQNALKRFNTLAAVFTMMQFREIKKPKMGHRFTREEKIMSLSLYKLGPRAYRWLSKIFVLPSPVTISRLVSKAGLKPGLNENIFNHLQKKTLKMKTDDKLCTLVFDEMALTPHLDYNRKTDKITGFVNYEGETIRKIADHVLVFMIRGITRSYKQPIYYSFSSGSTPKYVLAKIIKNIIKKLHAIGFTVLSTICDQGTSNTSAINHLINETKQEYLRRNENFKQSVFEVNGNRIIPLYDVPHMLKGLRNNLLTKNLKYVMDGQEKIAKWEHITKLYENNPSYKGLKMIKNLTEYHCNKDIIPKMKVKYASQLFSETVGKTMGFLAANGVLPADTMDTADLIIFVDNLFDSMNGSSQNSKSRSGKDLLRHVTPNSRHKEIWTMSKRVLKTMKFVTSTGKSASVPSVINWVQTIENMELLRDELFGKYNIKSIWCRHFNQDPLENFFGSIRSHGIRNVSPTCAAFEAAFASLLVNNLTSNYAVGSNCEEDSCENLDTFHELFFAESADITTESCDIEFEDFINIEIIEYENKIRNPIIRAQLEYVTGYLLRKIKLIINKCSNCNKELFEEDLNKNEYLTNREYFKNKRYLTYPKENVKKYFSAIQDVAHYVLKRKSHINNLKTYIKLLIDVSVETQFSNCNMHKKDVTEFMQDFCSRFFAYNWCKATNKLIDGMSRDCDDGDIIQKQSMLLGYKKRKIK